MSLLLLVAACKKDNNEGDEAAFLMGNWKVAQASDVKGPAADGFADFTITFAATDGGLNYTTNSQQTAVFPKSGSFPKVALSSANQTVEAERSPDKVKVTFARASDTQVRMRFTVSDVDNGRTVEVEGEYSFILMRVE